MNNDFIIPNNTKQVFLPNYGWMGPFNSTLDANQHVTAWVNSLSDEQWFEASFEY